ncbi:hypothetical protein EGH82_23055 [Vibrio ponticus]|uniref:Uncharacterized protein n=1 Tax=Vibrio ponticus TaxID=265668 RepID=A0A3N3DSE9_9VIBR|nr:hypothetical protein EGH82_23055 [Vibrio ponticus]
MSNMITIFPDNTSMLLFITLLLFIGLFYVVGRMILLRKNLKLSSEKVVRKSNSLTPEDASFIQSCIHFRKSDD